MAEEGKTSVKIQGKEYRISSKEKEEYIQKIAYYIDRKIKQIETANPHLDTSRVAILTALNIADELFKAVGTIETLRGKSNVTVSEPFLAEIENLQKNGVPKSEDEKPLHKEETKK